MHRLALIMSAVAMTSTAHADPEQLPDDELVGWVGGGRAPPPVGTVGTMAVGSAHPWFMCALGLDVGLRVGRLSLIGEGELDVPMGGTSAVMVRGGAELRLAVWRDRDPWSAWTKSKNTTSQSRTSREVFVEAGLGEEMIRGSSLSVTRHDLELGGGFAFGSGSRSQDARGRIGRASDGELYLRLRVLVAPPPSPADDESAVQRVINGPVATPSHDLGVFVDLGAVFGN